MEVVKVLVNTGGFVASNDRGPRLVVLRTPDERERSPTVTIPLHDELRTGTLRDIAESAGANDFDAFCEWVDRKA